MYQDIHGAWILASPPGAPELSDAVPGSLHPAIHQALPALRDFIDYIDNNYFQGMFTPDIWNVIYGMCTLVTQTAEPTIMLKVRRC